MNIKITCVFPGGKFFDSCALNGQVIISHLLLIY